LELPPETDLGSPEHSDTYAGVDYRCEDGTVYRGQPICYAGAIPNTAKHPVEAAALLSFLTSPTGRALLEEHGFRPVVAGQFAP
jgi:ABC-type molybdate transport system substrate-binding protein